MSSCALQSQQIHSSQDPGRPETIPFRMFVVQWCTRLHPWTCDRIGSTELWNSRKQLSRQTRMQRLVTTVEATFAFLSCLYPQKRVSNEILYSPNLGRKQQRCLVSVKRLKKNFHGKNFAHKRKGKWKHMQRSLFRLYKHVHESVRIRKFAGATDTVTEGVLNFWWQHHLSPFHRLSAGHGIAGDPIPRRARAILLLLRITSQ